MVRIAINGFGRIGRLVLRALIENHNKYDFQVVAINDLGSQESNIHLLKYDSVHGRLNFNIHSSPQGMAVANQNIIMTVEPNPEKLPWRDMQIDVVLECSGRFTTKDSAMKHIAAGAKKVLISAPAENADLTVVYGVNHNKITAEQQVISNASCTTNCLAPIASVLHQAIGIHHGYMTTIHAYTGDQSLVDSIHKDPRRSRAAALSMIPTSTGAAKAVGLVIPELSGKLDGTAIRVPTANVSLIDFKFVSKKEVTAEEINTFIIRAADTSYRNIINYTNEPLVSIDFNHSSYSSNFDLTQTQVIQDTFCRVVAWYDNEWGFSNRMLDTLLIMSKHLK